MPSADSRRIYEEQIPSFMSVYDLDAEIMADRETVTLVNPKLVGMEPKAPTLAAASRNPDLSPGRLSANPPNKHRSSVLSDTLESADSSPTTTFSTTNSSPLSDPSPSSSPDSPHNLIPLNNYPSSTFRSPGNFPMLKPRRLDTTLTTLERPMTSPAPRKPRNMKGLCIQPPSVVTGLSRTTAADPGSPSFIKPTIPAMRRKPSLLSINTSANDLPSKMTTLEVPPSPALGPILQRRALKHSASSPHMLLSVKTASFGPSGGMTFPSMLERNESGLSEVLRPMKTSTHATFAEAIAEEDSPIRTQLASRTDFPVAENDEEQKSPGYPSGPIAIYDDNVFLYSEPTADEASKFDLVINVAREVKNPFHDKRRSCLLSPVPDTATSTMSFATAFEYQPAEECLETSTAPKSNPVRTPEYIHMPWEHNTDIAPDLMHLCEIIEDRTKQGRKVLVHCQQGASRSASLIIAFGLYQRPELSVNDAYYAAQAKSRWISPNMKLMYSLQDFHKDLSKKRAPQNLSVSRPRARGNSTKHKLSLSSNAIDVDSTQPLTAPLPVEDGDTDQRQGRDGLLKSLATNLSDLQSVTPGPASAPLNFSWREEMIEKRRKHEEDSNEEMQGVETQRSRPDPTQRAEQPFREVRFQLEPQRLLKLAPIVPPDAMSIDMSEPELSREFGSLNNLPSYSPKHMNQLYKELSPIESVGSFVSAFSDVDHLASPRAEMMMGSPLRKMSDMPERRFLATAPEPAESLFSPRETTFSRNLFFSFGQTAPSADPRSPPTTGDTPIIRSIDDIL